MEPNITPDPNNAADAAPSGAPVGDTPAPDATQSAAPELATPESTTENGRTFETTEVAPEPPVLDGVPPTETPQPNALPPFAPVSAESQIAEVQAPPVMESPVVENTIVETTSVNAPVTPRTDAPQEAVPTEPEASDDTHTESAMPGNPATDVEAPFVPLPDVVAPSPAAAPPRSLVPGAFLRGEYEVKAVLSRGLTNIYQAQGGDYGSVTPLLIAEREALQGTESTPENGRTLTSSLFVQGEDFAQEDREYRVFPFFESLSLQDFRAATNDVQLLAMLHALAHGLAELDAQNLQADLTTETLRVDETGDLKFLGFVSPKNEGDDALNELREITDYLLKHVFAESSTMRLDDRFAGLALSEEVKDLARKIDKDAPQPFAHIGEVAAAIEAIYQPQRALVVDAALLSDVGQERELNEDSGMIVRMERSAHLGSRAFDLYVVSDGMGGHEGGEVASDLTMTSLQKNLDALQIDWNDNVAIRAALVDVIDAVNADVVALTETPKYRGTRAKPGATLTFAVRLGARVFVCNVGDSRAFKFNGKLARVSKDHSYVQTLVDRGEITEEEAWDHPEGSIITAHIGYPKLKTRDVFLRLFAPGDTLLLVSDGITDMLRDSEVESYLQGATTESAATICRDLVDAANAAGGLDNITTLCVIFK